jgi:hypothetical protein
VESIKWLSLRKTNLNLRFYEDKKYFCILLENDLNNALLCITMHFQDPTLSMSKPVTRSIRLVVVGCSLVILGLISTHHCLADDDPGSDNPVGPRTVTMPKPPAMNFKF